ncbi:uncharacterized protein LOC34621582 [Cyclospora cayetanensis]|uniref:Mitochondrial pyruvate carrier n=1 Tax=Cyclospora cayetanensis TaxID=88456 RepID=A0A6P6RRQ0_9EIME|nr:uncharacterized protein LOC34621582 [Cyclospora cayetanensis]
MRQALRWTAAGSVSTCLRRRALRVLRLRIIGSVSMGQTRPEYRGEKVRAQGSALRLVGTIGRTTPTGPSAAAAGRRSLFFPGIVPALQRRAMQLPLPQKAKSIIEHPAGPFTIHFWAPTLKWGISIANILDIMDKDAASISPEQQIAVAATGLIWSRYSMVIRPKNWNLFSVNVVMAFTGCLQLGRVACREYKVRTGSYSNTAQESTESNPHEDGTHSNSKDSSAASA